MTQPVASIDALVFWCSAGAIWVGICWFYRDYRVDRFRQNLFAIRDELFDLAADGEIAFDSPAYLQLRNTINGFIRFGHRLGFWWYVGAAWNFQLAVEEGCAQHFSFSRRWKDAVAELPADKRKKLNTLLGRVHFELVEQVVMVSPIFLVLVALAFAVLAVWSLGEFVVRRASWRLHRHVGSALRTVQRAIYDRADSTALAVGGVH